jgi:hypothetical protein
MSSIPPVVEALLRTVARARHAARQGNKEALLTLVVLADELCEAIESVRHVQPEMVLKVARIKGVWSCNLRNRKECITDTYRVLDEIELGQGLPNAQHITTVSRRRGQRATAYLNRHAEDAFKDIIHLRKIGRESPAYALAAAALALPPNTTVEVTGCIFSSHPKS